MTDETVLRLRGTPGAGRHGDDATDWTSAATVEIPGCAIDPGPTSEVNVGRTAVLVDLTVLAPPGADVLPSDRLLIRGKTYEVVGEVQAFRNPHDSSCDGDVINANRVDG